jgi:Flp pilus assembly protein TadG
MKGFKRIKNNKGQSVVEMALLLPVLLLILLGIIEFGRIYGAYMVINNAARDGARMGSVGSTSAQIQTAVINNTGSLNAANISVVVSKSGTGGRGDAVTVTIGYDIPIMAPFLGIVVDNPMHLEADMTMRIE